MADAAFAPAMLEVAGRQDCAAGMRVMAFKVINLIADTCWSQSSRNFAGKELQVSMHVYAAASS